MWIAVLTACHDDAGALRYAPASFAPAGEPEETSSGTGSTVVDGTTPPTSSTSSTSTTPTTTTPTGSTPTTPGDVVCYPGPAYLYDVCFDVVDLAPVPYEYEYPAPLDGSAQYAAPTRFLDLSQADPGAQIAPNFVLDEVAQEYKGQYAVMQVHGIEQIQDVRDALGPLIVNSAYRSPSYNAGIGGATWSRHMYGDGFDLDPIDTTLDALIDECYAEGADYVGVYVAHIHCDWRNSALDPAFYPVSSAFVGGPVPLPVPLPVHGASLIESAGELSAPAEGWDEGEPLREWTAYGADGAVVATAVSPTFHPPPEAVEVEVVVGREVVIRQPVSPPTAP